MKVSMDAYKSCFFTFYSPCKYVSHYILYSKTPILNYNGMTLFFLKVSERTMFTFETPFGRDGSSFVLTRMFSDACYCWIGMWGYEILFLKIEN